MSDLARQHIPEPVEDIVMLPLQHDTPDELAQPEVRDWKTGEVDAVPGVTMPKFKLVERDYVNLYEQMVSLGRGVAQNGVARTACISRWRICTRNSKPANRANLANRLILPCMMPEKCPRQYLHLDPASNGELAHRAFELEEQKTGLSLTDLAAGSRDARYTFDAIVAQPRRILTAPTWSGIVNQGRAYSPFTLNKERLIPWRTLTGRQHFYLDHETYLFWGEHLPTYKPRPDHTMLDETQKSLLEGQGKLLNSITPHGKWSIHSTYSDNHRMMTLSRGGYPVWLNDKDASELGIKDNDWVEVFNDNGVFIQRAIVSARIPPGAVFVYHATERTIGVPKSPLRGGKRAGMNNSLTRARLKPVLMAGGYAQFTYFFNYWGPTGVNRDTFVFVHRIDKPEVLTREL